MHLRTRLITAGAAVLTTIPLTLFGSTAQAAPHPPASATTHACPAPAPGFASCMAIVRTDTTPPVGATPATTPSGYGPADLQSAFNLPSATAGSGQTIAVVDAYDDPNAEADLGVYRSQYGLPPCTTANGCFKKIDQNGGTNYPRADSGWAEEISVDLDMVSAICPNCRILLVEASSNSFANLGAAENQAAASGVSAINNSYGGSDAADSSYGSYYNHPGIAITASSGDGGYGIEYPASSHYVTAVGATSLVRDSTVPRGWREIAMNPGGCSAYNTALTAQANVDTGCSTRAVVDVAAVGDPNTGVAGYDSYGGVGGWLVFGGTSVSSPIIAGVYGLAGNTASIDNNYPYYHASSLNDITSGGSCSTDKLCHAGPGWDGPTGMGTPNGTGAF